MCFKCGAKYGTCKCHLTAGYHDMAYGFGDL